VSLAAVAAWLAGGPKLDDRDVVLTFDDGYEDFATEAFPELARRGWPATVFLPAGRVGGSADWGDPAGGRPGRLMTWETIERLARLGVEFGAHGVTHRAIDSLPADVARDEIVRAKALIEERTGCAVTSFAAPYGRTNATARHEISHHYALAVGTSMGRARPGSDIYDLPRIEMWYFRDERRWWDYLNGRSAYFVLRQALRALRAGLGVGA
jgi:peptidoglycan/xylan/chitin deacetylase (PgdA/CDA1 family)